MISSYTGKELEPKEIDYKLRKIIPVINELGFETSFCCQGETSKPKGKHSHSIDGYIKLNGILSPDLVNKALDLGLYIEFQFGVNLTCIIRSYDNTYLNLNNLDRYKINKQFPAKIKKVFGI